MSKTIEVPTTETLAFEFRMNKDVLRDNAQKVQVEVNLDKLTAADLLEWAFSAMVVSYQSKLRSQKPPVIGEDGKYHWDVPSRGTRSIADPAKVEEAATKLLGKMSAEQKYHFLINSAGLSAAMASAATGFEPAKS